MLFFAITAQPSIYTLSLHDALPIFDRAKLKRAAEGGDAPSRRALRVTERLSFMLSGAQLGITVTALLVGDRKSTRLNSSHSQSSYAAFCLKKKIACEQGTARRTSTL